MAIFELRGQVIDSLTHAGISGCEIELWLVGNDAPYYSEMHCLTISNGSFSLTGTFDKLNIDVTQFFLKVKIDQDVVKQSSLYNIIDVKDKVLLINIEVDTVSKSGNMRVQGRLVLSDGAPLSGKYIVVYDKSLSDLTQLGFATTDEDGYYVVGYDFPLEGSNKVSPDIILKVFSDSTETELIASSPLFLSAKASLEVNLTTDEIFKDRSRFDSCFRRLVNDEEVFDKILDGQVNQSIRLENIKVLHAADISYLSNRLQVDSKEISLVFKALELLLDCDFYSLDNLEMLYGIFSMTKIATAPGVFYSSKEQLLGMMATAGEQNVTKTFSQQDCEDFIDDLKEKIITLVVSDSENEQLNAFFTCCGLGSSTQDVETKKEILNCLLQDIESSTDENEDVVSYLTTKIGNSGISSTLVKKVELFINAYHFSQNLQFTTELFNGFVSNIDQLTSKNKSDLVSFLTTHAIGLPNGYSSLEEFATFIRSKIIAKYPEKVLNLLFDTDGYFTNTKVKTFLGLNADYPLLSNTVSDILSNESIVLTGFDEQQIIDLKKEMGRAQRLCYLVPLNDWENSLKVLWEMGFEGSIDLTLNKTEDDFVSAFSIAYAELLQVATDVSINAKYIYRLSRLQNDVNLGIWSKYSQQLNSLSSRVLPTGAITNSENDSPALPTFEDLFGGSDFCRCSSGRSVTSPAAYLADLLNFEVQQTATSTGTINVYELLGSRRPDITKLLLNEKNTFTELPYIDLVIELLGDVIQSDIPYDLPGHNTTLDTLTLLAIPEHLESLDSAILKVYGNDQNPVVYPWSLPYNYWLEECRAWLEHLTVSRYKLMEYFPYLSQESSNLNDNGTDYIIEEPGDKEYFIHTQGSLAGEYLGLNKNEVTQVFNSELSVTALYNIDDISTLITVGDFLRKSGLTYTEIKELLQSYYVNPKTTLENTEYRIYIVLATKEIVKDSGHFMEDCDLNKASFMLCSTVDNIDIPGEIFIGFLKRIYQYTILKRKLRIGVPLLDFILKSTNYIHDPINLLLDESLLPKIHDILLLSRDYSIDVEDVILFYDEFDRDLVYEGYTGKFDMLFRNKSFGSQEDVFDTSPLPRLDDSRVRTILCSALSISEADYNTLLIYEGLYDPESPNDTKLASTLNISLIYRTITFCKFLGIEQKDYYRLIAINNNKTPVQRLYVGSYQPEPSDTRFFIDVFRQLQNMAITPLELNLMFGNRMLSSLSDIFSITDKSDFCTDLANKLKSRKQELDVQLGLNIEHQRGTVIDNLYRHLWESDQEISNIDETVELVLRVIEMDPTVNINSTEVSQAFSFAFPNGSATLQYYMNYTGDDQYALYEYAINCWTDQVAPKKLNALREIFASLMSVSELEIAVELVHDGNDDPDSVPYNQIIQQYFSLFMDANEAVEILLENSDTYNNRVEFVLNHWETHILESIIINCSSVNVPQIKE